MVVSQRNGKRRAGQNNDANASIAGTGNWGRTICQVGWFRFLRFYFIPNRMCEQTACTRQFDSTPSALKLPAAPQVSCFRPARTKNRPLDEMLHGPGRPAMQARIRVRNGRYLPFASPTEAFVGCPTQLRHRTLDRVPAAPSRGKQPALKVLRSHTHLRSPDTRATKPEDKQRAVKCTHLAEKGLQQHAAAGDNEITM